jgi:hypothetical protein
MFQYAYLYAQARRGEIEDVYVQDEGLFYEYADEIKALFSAGIGLIDMVAIHVRRGDYVDNPFYVNLMETDYYQDAMELFPGAKFLVFSDDIKWCRKQPIFKGCDFSKGKDEILDLNLMASCNGVITANSSFSWWGGWLSSGKVVAPSVDHWYTDGVERTRCPQGWIRL